MIVNWNFELTNLALAGVAIWALLFARRQVLEMCESNRKLADSAAGQERQMRANVLLSLDQRWESEPLISQRTEMRRVMEEVLFKFANKPPTPTWPKYEGSAPAYLSRCLNYGCELRLRSICVCSRFADFSRPSVIQSGPGT